ncbi:hypothetical protein O3G_MSEX012999, partial [Manduca sexta]
LYHLYPHASLPKGPGAALEGGESGNRPGRRAYRGLARGTLEDFFYDLTKQTVKTGPRCCGNVALRVATPLSHPFNRAQHRRRITRPTRSVRSPRSPAFTSLLSVWCLRRVALACPCKGEAGLCGGRPVRKCQGGAGVGQTCTDAGWCLLQTDTRATRMPSAVLNGSRGSHSPDDIVLTGLSGRLPESDNIEEFARQLFDGVDLVTADDRRWTPADKGDPTRDATRSPQLLHTERSTQYRSARSTSLNTWSVRLMLCHSEGALNTGPNLSSLAPVGVTGYVGVRECSLLSARNGIAKLTPIYVIRIRSLQVLDSNNTIVRREVTKSDQRGALTLIVNLRAVEVPAQSLSTAKVADDAKAPKT